MYLIKIRVSEFWRDQAGKKDKCFKVSCKETFYHIDVGYAQLNGEENRGPLSLEKKTLKQLFYIEAMFQKF